MRLKGKVALITGASRGIGKSVAEGFAGEGANSFLVGNRDQDALQQTLREVRALGVEAEGGLFDVGSYGDVKRIADAIERRFGTLDIVVNNDGIINPTPLLEIAPEQWERTIRNHLNGTFYCTLEMVNSFLKRKRAGKIVNVAAAAALKAYQGVADYGSAKGGIVAFTRNAARELMPLNIQVNCVVPVAQSRMIDSLGDYYGRQFGAGAGAKIKDVAPPRALVPSFLFFASSDSDYVTGQILTADGGATA